MVERLGERMEGMLRLFLRGVEGLETERGLEILLELRVDELEVDSGKEDDEERSMRSEVTAD